MRFSYAESMCDPSQYAPLARAAEAAGWHSFVVPDSLCYPEVSDSKYPYTADGNREFLADAPFLDPFALCAALGAVTERLRFTTFVLKLPIRSPVLVAKSACSVAVLTNDRLALGVGPLAVARGLRGDGHRLGDPRPAHRRGDRRSCAVSRAASSSAFHGAHYRIPSIRMKPAPAQAHPDPGRRPRRARAAPRRAAGRRLDARGRRSADAGALHRAGCASCAASTAASASRSRSTSISLDAYTVDGVRRLEDQGVTDAIVGFRNSYERDTQTLQHKLDALRGFADRVISKV